MRKPVLVFDFDNTLTSGDVLDDIIREFSPNEDWVTWEMEWVEGRLPARDCLRLQVENLRVTRSALMKYLLAVRIDPVFKSILAWARRNRTEVVIVSDSFLPLIRHILENNAIDAVPVFANDLAFSVDRLHASFPYHDEAFPKSANAKANHLLAYAKNTIIFAGDGRSDVDAALASDIVFAKDTLARELTIRKVAYLPFDTLEPVLSFLQTFALRHAKANSG
jgi:2-hydroxy-3-keto-5-methylthiopentenyl-1-phosphate phosphatase